MREKAELLFTALAFALLFGLMFVWTLQEPMLPNEDDCLARGQAADCWKEFDGAAYDENGHRVIRDGLRR